MTNPTAAAVDLTYDPDLERIEVRNNPDGSKTVARWRLFRVTIARIAFPYVCWCATAERARAAAQRAYPWSWAHLTKVERLEAAGWKEVAE